MNSVQPQPPREDPQSNLPSSGHPKPIVIQQPPLFRDEPSKAEADTTAPAPEEQHSAPPVAPAPPPIPGASIPPQAGKPSSPSSASQPSYGPRITPPKKPAPRPQQTISPPQPPIGRLPQAQPLPPAHQSVPPAAYAPVETHHRIFAAAAHMGIFFSILLVRSPGIAFLFLMVPVAVYLFKKDESRFVADQAREAINVLLTLLITIPTLFMLSFLIFTLVLTGPMLFFIAAMAIVLPLIAAYKNLFGMPYRYPFILRLFK